MAETFSVQEIKHFQHQVKNSKKCNNEEFVARVKAMIDEDVRILLQKIASALNISWGSESNILLYNRLSYCKRFMLLCCSFCCHVNTATECGVSAVFIYTR